MRRYNLSAERHHRRNQSFFYGMLGAQLGVIVSTLAIAARQRNLLWSLAAAGTTAVTFAATCIGLSSSARHGAGHVLRRCAPGYFART